MDISGSMKSLRHVLPLALVSAILLSSACASSSKATPKTERLCTPDAWVYCRCQNRDEGSKQCNEEGSKFGPCLPCETPDNPVLDDEDPFPIDEPDGGPLPEPATCGDKVVQEGEACDDGNTDDTDGCSAACKLAGADPPSSRTCPGMPVHVWGSPVEYIGTTVGAPNAFYPDPVCSTPSVPTRGQSGPERIFAVTPHKSGVLVATTADAGMNTVLWMMQPCKVGTSQAPATYLSCANLKDNNDSERVELPVQAGQTYAVVVDGANINSLSGGPFKVTFSMK